MTIAMAARLPHRYLLLNFPKNSDAVIGVVFFHKDTSIRPNAQTATCFFSHYFCLTAWSRSGNCNGVLPLGYFEKCKKQHERRCFHAAFYRRSDSVRAITYRGSRQRRSASCGHGRGEKPARDGRSWWPFSRGSHACSHDDDCEAGMFFSFSLIFNCLLLLVKQGMAKAFLLGCKITHNFLNGKEISVFSALFYEFFIKM